ncbi:MAG: hypothetical protein DMF76_21890, partial [Acidobacteria bacterium]
MHRYKLSIGECYRDGACGGFCSLTAEVMSAASFEIAPKAADVSVVELTKVNVCVSIFLLLLLQRHDHA